MSIDLDKAIRVPSGKYTFVFGSQVGRESDEGSWRSIASKVWPVEIYRQVESGEYGVIYLYETTHGHRLHGSMAAGAWIEKSSGKKACVKAATAGVQIYPGTEHLFASALGAWCVENSDCQDAPWVSLVSTPGWHESLKVYVNGRYIFGQACADWKADDQAIAIQHRSGRDGTLSQWRKQADEHLTTYGLQAGVGLSLAGPLVGLLNMVPFGLHFCGDSSRGKSTVGRLAASLWGNPDNTFQSWDSTLRALEGLADSADGACLVLDEIKRFRGGEDQLSAGIHSICSQQGRARLRSDGSMAVQRSWRCTLLSTGEVRVQDALGEHYQGGHRVRLMDMWIGDSGALTIDAAHAKAVDKLSQEMFGVVSDAWIEHVTNTDKQTIKNTWDVWRDVAMQVSSSGAEEGRIAGNLALVCTAIELAKDAGILQREINTRRVLAWMIECIQEASEDETQAKSPNERALDLLMQWVDTQPHRFPVQADMRNARNVIGYRDTIGMDETSGYQIYTTRAMIKASRLPVLAGVEPKRWLDWLVDNQLAHQARERFGGLQRRWTIIPCDACDILSQRLSQEKANEELEL